MLMFYDVQGHKASFALPPVALRELAKPPPLLKDTCPDLEEIMAYKEEGGTGQHETRISSQNWEPDVSFWVALNVASCILLHFRESYP